MTASTEVPNRLINEKSPYLLQHAYNPVDWYPWGEEAFEKARQEDKPVFLSIGYSTCHWCHVMEHESFEDDEVAEILNRHFVSIKVDKEERPDIDSIYMNVCMAINGNGGWPMTIIMDHSGKPFFAGTYFPKHKRYGTVGLIDLLTAVSDEWQSNKEGLLRSSEDIVNHIKKQEKSLKSDALPADDLAKKAAKTFKASFDEKYGGFGRAPKFPTPHNLLFLMEYYRVYNDEKCLMMAEKTLLQMAKGGLFDHIGFGFSRYSTDEKWLVPHFEKMLYDNALLIMAYTTAYEITQNAFYKNIAEKTIAYIQRELTDEAGGFYSAQDADSEGVEGKYYVFSPDEIISVLGEEHGKKFNQIFDITEEGNFEGTSIPNQIKNQEYDDSMAPLLSKLYEYRRKRTRLHKDDKVLTSWNGLMIAALARASIVFSNESYLEIAKRSSDFILKNSCEGDTLFASFRDGNHSSAGFIDDYAFMIYAFIELYNATLDPKYLKKAGQFTKKAISDFFDHHDGGFYLYGNQNEQLITRPKEGYDGAIPSGNSVMVLNLYWLSVLKNDAELEEILEKQLDFMNRESSSYPSGYCFFLLSLLKVNFSGKIVTAVLDNESERDTVAAKLKGKALVTILDRETDEYKLKNGKTTYYICENGACHPPVNDFME